MRTSISYFLLLLIAGTVFGIFINSRGLEKFMDGQPLSLHPSEYVVDMSAQQITSAVACSAFIAGLALVMYTWEVIQGRRVDKTIEERRRQARRRYYAKKKVRKQKEREALNQQD
jgi:hypothetical protein